MNRSAILHIPMSQYAYGTDEEHVTIRLRAAKGDISRCILYYGDRSCRKTPVEFTKAPMYLAASSKLFDFYQVDLERPYKRLCYYFCLQSKDEEILYYGDQFATHPVDDRSEYYQFPYNHRADLVTPPAWAKDAVIYNIFPDSFATGEGFISGKSTEISYGDTAVRGKLGGTLRGIIENVGYVKALGVNAIYINPIFAAGEYHKYDLVDYFHIDPCFGTNEDFRELVEVYHKEGIRVIIDGVFNHCGWHFPAFEDVVKNGENSDKKDWFYRLTFPVVRPKEPEEYPGYECFGYERMMPKLNTQNPEVEDFLCGVGRYWVEEFHTDGWRLDVASEVNDGFWRRFYREIKAVNPEAILIGEVWESANHWLDGTIFDSTMNYDFRRHCRRFFAEGTADAAEFDSRVTDMRMRYRKQTVYAQLNVLDSHDVSRFLSLCGGDEALYRLAVVFQMTFPGMPSVFYGDELGVSGILEEDYRKPMPWGKETGLFSFFREMIRLRKAEMNLRRGEFRTVFAQQEGGLYVFDRCGKEDAVRVILNRNRDTADIGDYLPGMTYEILLAEGLLGEELAGLHLKGRGFAPRFLYCFFIC